MGDATTINLTILTDSKQTDTALKQTGTLAEENLGNLSKKAVAAGADVEVMGGKTAKAGEHAEEASGHLDKVSESTEKAGKAAQGAAGGMGTMVEAFAAAETVKEVTDEFTANQKALDGLKQAMADAGEKETPAFTDGLEKAGEAGRNMGFETSATTDAIEQLRLAGVNTADGFKALPTIMDLARAKNISLSDATSAVVKGMQGQGKALKDLNVTLPATLPTMAALTAANAAALAGQQKAQAAQDKYNETVAKFGPASKQAVAAHTAMEKAITASDAAGEKANGISEQLANRTQNLGTVLDTLNGKVGGQAAAHTKDLGVQWDILKAKFNEVGSNVIGNIVMPAFSALVGVFGLLADHANIAVPVILALVAAFVAFKVISGIITVIEVFSTAIEGLGVAMDVLAANPMTLAFVAVAAILVILQAKFGIFTKIIDAVAPVFSKIGQVAGQVMNAIVGAVSSAINYLKPVFEVVFAVWKVAFGVWLTVVTTYIKVVIAVIGGIVTGIQAVLSPIISVIGAILGVVFTIWKTEFSLIIGVVTGVIKVVIAVIQTVVGVAQTVAHAVLGPFQTVAGGISSAFQGAVNVVSGIFRGIGNVLKGPLNGIIAAINSVIGAVDSVQIHIHMPDWAGGAGFDWNGVNVSKIPSLALGGIVSATPGGRLVRVAEAGKDEAIMPLPKGWQTGSPARPAPSITVNVTQNNPTPYEIGQAVAWAIKTGRA